MAQLAITKVLAICLAVCLTLGAAGPIKKRSTSGDSAVFEMETGQYDEMDWSKNQTAVELVEETKPLKGNCPSQISTDPNDGLHKRSSCPWTYELDYNSTRYPASILIAKPRCQYCIKDGATEEDKRYECAPINHDVPILVRDIDAVNGKYNWTPSIKRIAIGFTCSGRKIGAAATPAPPAAPTAESADAPTTTEDYAYYD